MEAREWAWPRRRAAGWQAIIEAEAARLHTDRDVAATLRRRDTARPAGPVLNRIDVSLQAVYALLRVHAGRRSIGRMIAAGRTYERALGLLQQVREDLLLVQDGAAVLAQVISLRAAVQARLGPDDPRTESFLRVCDDVAAGPDYDPSVTEVPTDDRADERY
jgi:hypothetical protein